MFPLLRHFHCEIEPFHTLDITTAQSEDPPNRFCPWALSPEPLSFRPIGNTLISSRSKPLCS
jgi:hypothetical protein